MNDDQSKVMSLRLPNELAAEIKALADAEEVPISEAIRAAIYGHIATRRADKRFQEKLRKRLEREVRTLEQLSG
jgi:predicted DNA-binding protein